MQDDPFVSLREKLELQEWPTIYLFKFIVPNTPELIARVKTLFISEKSVTLTPSKTGKFVSVGAKQHMPSADSVIAVYQQASTIPGIISL